MFFISNPSLRKLEAFMQEVPNFPPKGVKVDLDKLEDEILLFEVEKVIVNLKQHKGKERIMKFRKDVLNLTYNLLHYTLIKDTADLDRRGFVHMCNICDALTASEFENKAWLAEKGSKLINSGKGIDTEYGKIFVN